MALFQNLQVPWPGTENLMISSGDWMSVFGLGPKLQYAPQMKGLFMLIMNMMVLHASADF